MFGRMEIVTNNKRKRILSAIPLVCVLILIFANSSKTAPESSVGSSWITITVLRFFLGKERVAGLDNSVFELTETLIRKAAHITEFAILAVTAAFHQWVSYKNHFIKGNTRRYYLWNILLCTMYAATDEFHQLFVAGRSGQVTDVLIDLIGIVLGTILFYIIIGKRRRGLTWTYLNT